MTPDIAAIVDRARQTAATSTGSPSETREKLVRVAQEFESMLLVQVLKDMRRAGEWKDESDEGGLGADSLFETLDVELASHLTRAKGMGLSDQLLKALDRFDPQKPVEPDMDLLPIEAQREFVAPARDFVPAARAYRAAPAAAAPTPVASPVAAPARVAAPAAVPTPAAAPVSHAPHVSGAPTPSLEVIRPVDGAVTSSFGWRKDPFTNRMKFHQGVDLRATYGEEVQSAGAGRVVFSGEQGGYGTTVMVEHADGTRTRYAHLSARLVQKGDQVAAGSPLGRAGRSGHATGTHLHFEVIAQDGRRVQPEQWARVHTASRTGAAD